jgi:hypothetical protein
MYNLMYGGIEIMNSDTEFESLQNACYRSVHMYASNNLRSDKLILIKFDVGEFYEKLSSHFSFHQVVLMTPLHHAVHEFLCTF